MDVEDVLFEAGKISSTSSKQFIFSSAVLLVFLVQPKGDLLVVPFINVKLEFIYAVSVLLSINVLMFYRFIAAINYERIVRNEFKKIKKSSIKKAYLASYPSIFNYHRIFSFYDNKKRSLFIEFISAVALFVNSVIIPGFAINRILDIEISTLTISFSIFSICVILFTFSILMSVRIR